MNKLLRPLLFTALAALFVVACKKNNYIVDVDPTDPGAYAKFNVKATADTAGVYYIRSTGETYNIPVGITNTSSVDRVVNFCYTSNKAVQGVQYNGPTSVTIKAGQTLDTLRVQGLFNGYPLSSRIDTVFIKICGGDVPASSYWNNYRLIMRKYCDVNLTALAGNYANTNEYTSSGAFSYGPYLTKMKNIVSTGATTATAQIENLYDDGWSDINVVLNWTNPAAFTVTIPSQPTGKGYNVVSTGTNTFSSCDRSISLNVNLVQGSTVLSSNYKFVMK
jgi:hypothetical protein